MAKAWEISAALAKSNAKGMGKFDAAVDAAVAKGYGKGKTQLSPPAKGLEKFDAADEAAVAKGKGKVQCKQIARLR